jgi:hypothetical protein
MESESLSVADSDSKFLKSFSKRLVPLGGNEYGN